MTVGITLGHNVRAWFKLTVVDPTPEEIAILKDDTDERQALIEALYFADRLREQSVEYDDEQPHALFFEGGEPNVIDQWVDEEVGR